VTGGFDKHWVASKLNRLGSEISNVDVLMRKRVPIVATVEASSMQELYRVAEKVHQVEGVFDVDIDMVIPRPERKPDHATPAKQKTKKKAKKK